MHWVWLFTAVLVLFPVAPSWGHPGNTAADGCHYCRTNCAKWGEVEGARHCHGGGARPNRQPRRQVQPPRGAEPRLERALTGQVRIIDADTVHLGVEKIRLQGIDAPEAQQSCQRANEASYACGQEATAALTRLIGGRALTCRFAPNRDRYQRLLGTCFLGELDVNGWLVANGHAVAYTEYSRRYVVEEAQAKQQRRGIHAGQFIPPSRWRKGEREIRQ